MGGKRSRARQHLRICLALLILSSGCSFFTRPAVEPKITPTERKEPVEPPVAYTPEPLPPPLVIPESPEARDQREAKQYLQLAQNLLAKGDYEGSLRENQKVVSLAKNQAPADEALFTMGLVYVHPKNPKKDNKRAIAFFNRVVKSYPDSPWTEQAKIWVGVLDGVEKLKQVDIEIEEKKRDRSK